MIIHRYYLIEYPTTFPAFSFLSCATLSATPMADSLLGWVHTMLQWSLGAECSKQSSRMYCGTWVLLPQPVIPDITTT